MRWETEAALLPQLLTWLQRTRRIRSDTIIATEVPWFGRRIDLVTVTKSGRVTTYELKLRKSVRAVEQAAYNRIAAERSYVVSPTTPTGENLSSALALGVGIVLCTEGGIRMLHESPMLVEDDRLRARLIALATARGRELADV